MFRELEPVLSKNNLVITVTRIGDHQIRLTVTPRSTSKDESKALSLPFSVEGSAAELDAELAATLISYTAEHLTCSRAIERVKEATEAELKAIKEESARKVADAKKTAGTKSGAAAKPREDLPTKPAAEPQKPASPMLSLFGGDDVEPEPTPPPAAPVTRESAEAPDEMIGDDAETSDDDDEEQDLFREASYDGAGYEDAAA